MANQGLHINVLDPMYTRYIPVGKFLETYLEERYGPNIDFDVSHQNDRWLFRAPEMLDRKQLKCEFQDHLVILYLTSHRNLSKEVVAQVDRAKAEAAQAEAATIAGAQQGVIA